MERLYEMDDYTITNILSLIPSRDTRYILHERAKYRGEEPLIVRRVFDAVPASVSAILNGTKPNEGFIALIEGRSEIKRADVDWTWEEYFDDVARQLTPERVMSLDQRVAFNLIVRASRVDLLPLIKRVPIPSFIRANDAFVYALIDKSTTLAWSPEAVMSAIVRAPERASMWIRGVFTHGSVSGIVEITPPEHVAAVIRRLDAFAVKYKMSPAYVSVKEVTHAGTVDQLIDALNAMTILGRWMLYVCDDGMFDDQRVFDTYVKKVKSKKRMRDYLQSRPRRDSITRLIAALTPR